VNGLDLQTREVKGEQSPELEIVPRLAFLIETHADAAQVERFLPGRVRLLAYRMYGSEIDEREEDYKGTKLKIYRARQLDRELVTAQRGSLLLVGNGIESIQSCLDVQQGGQPRLSQDPYLQQARERLGKNSTAFAFITGRSLARLLQLGGLFMSGGGLGSLVNRENDDLTKVLSSQIINGMAYSSSFDSGQVLERYLLLLRPEIADALRRSVKPADDKPEVTNLFSSMDVDLTLLRVQRPAETLEQALAGISANVNVVVSFALRKLVTELGRQYGVEPDDPIGPLVGNEMALVKFQGPQEPKSALLIEVKDKVKLLPTLSRYLRRDKNPVKSEDYRGVEIVVASGSEARAAAFLGNYLLLAPRDQIVAIIDARESSRSGVGRIEELIKQSGKEAVIISSRSDRRSAAELMLGLSRALRATDGSRELLNDPLVQSAVAGLPLTVSGTQLVADGVLMESRSPLGAFTLLSGFLTDPAGELREELNTEIKRSKR
jgi:hypothetical protein